MSTQVSHDEAPTTTRSPAPEPDLVSDRDLIDRVRQGDMDDYAVLFARYHATGIRYATALAGPTAADDLVADAFAQTLALLRAGRGPVHSFRAYLLVAIRSHHVNRLRRQARLTVVGHHEELEVIAPVGVDDGSAQRFEAAMARQAFESLPPRWRQILWLTSVEGRSHPEIAEIVGLTPNAAAGLAYRAREGLRRAFIAEHLRATDRPACAAAAADLAAQARGGLSAPRARVLVAHLAACEECRERRREAEAVASTVERKTRVA